MTSNLAILVIMSVPSPVFFVIVSHREKKVNSFFKKIDFISRYIAYLRFIACYVLGRRLGRLFCRLRCSRARGASHRKGRFHVYPVYSLERVQM